MAKKLFVIMMVEVVVKQKVILHYKGGGEVRQKVILHYKGGGEVRQKVILKSQGGFWGQTKSCFSFFYKECKVCHYLIGLLNKNLQEG